MVLGWLIISYAGAVMSEMLLTRLASNFERSSFIIAVTVALSGPTTGGGAFGRTAAVILYVYTIVNGLRWIDGEATKNISLKVVSTSCRAKGHV
jgi:hypothetical protein